MVSTFIMRSLNKDLYMADVCALSTIVGNILSFHHAPAALTNKISQAFIMLYKL